MSTSDGGREGVASEASGCPLSAVEMMEHKAVDKLHRLRLAELMAALSLATDLGMGQPLEQALRTCLIAIELAERMGLAKDEVSEMFGGDEIAARGASAPVLGGSPPELARVMLQVGAGQGPLRRMQLIGGLVTGVQRAREGLRAHCEMAERLALRLGLPEGVQRSLGDAVGRWDGLASPKGTSGNQMQISARIVFVARDAEVLQRQGGSERLRAGLRARIGRAYDPAG